MDEKPEKLEAERQQTDESLQAERTHSDALISTKLAELAARSDRSVDDARDDANAASDDARRETDRAVHAVDTSAAAKQVLATERASQDVALEDERNLVDAARREDRVAHARVLAALRPLARESTDRSLLIERDRSDAAVDNRDHFLGIVSHDLRNLLSGVAYAANRLSDGATREATSAIAERIRRYAAHMDRLIGDLLDVGSIEAGRLGVTVRPGSIRDVLAESVAAVEPLATARRITIDIEPGPSLPATFDHDRLVQVVTNLLSNAVKFSSNGGAVEVSAVDDGKDVTVRVDDRGVGIPDGMRETVFERFWQVPGRGIPGTGLGLFISRHLVAAHGGRIWAESRPGGGTRLQFTFPSDFAEVVAGPPTSH